MESVTYLLQSSTGVEESALTNHCMDHSKGLTIEADVCPARWTSASKISGQSRVDISTILIAPTSQATPDMGASVPKSIERASSGCMKSSGSTWLYAGSTRASDMLAVSVTMVISAFVVSFMFVELSGI